MIDTDPGNVDSMVLCVWKEARGEGNDGMRAVAHVICNRVGAPDFPKTLHDVIYQRNAFTSMTDPSDPEYNLQPPPGDVQYAYCEQLCDAVLNGYDEDPTNGAHYYANLKTATSGWFSRVIAGPDGNGTPEHPSTVTIGKQRFYV